MRTLILTTLLLAGCGTPSALCKTRCGLELASTSSGWTCEAFQHAEDLALAHFDADVRGDNRFKGLYACRRLDGWRVVERPEDIIVLSDGTWILGRTFCAAGGVANQLEIARSKVPHRGALAHELAHVIQNCDPWESNAADPSHAGWSDHNIFWAIENVRAEP